jgi:polyisoprenoid-binding protein YceI
MKSLFLILTSVMLMFSGDAEKTNWQLDGGHSSLRFSVKHQGVANFNGSFGRFDVNIQTTGEDFSTMQVEMSADIASINTNDATRDEHLLAEDFFNAEKFPKMTFKSKSVKKKGKNGYIVSGDFTMRGVTKTVELTAVHNATVYIENDGQKIPLAGLKITGMVKRSDFGVAPEFKDIVNDVYLDADIEIYKATAEK